MNVAHGHVVFVHGASAVHRLPAVVKLAALAVVVLAVVSTPREQVGALVAEAAGVAGVAVAARLRPAVVAGRLLLGAPFLAFAAALPFVGSAPSVDVHGVALSVEGLWAAWSILAKGGVCLAAAVTVTATTTVPDILDGLTRLRVPSLIVDIASFMMRYLDILSAEAARVRTAMTVRGYAPRWMWQTAPTAGAASALFVRSYERGERIHRAMVARGFAGEMPRMDRGEAAAREWARGAAFALPMALVALGAIVEAWRWGA